jgi:hypothetical protein
MKPEKRSLASSCGLCGKAIRYGRGNKKALAQGLNTGADTHDLDAKSEMHYAHVSGKSRSRKQFTTLPKAVWEQMGVKNPKGSRTCCYECHEVLMHNIIVGESDLDLLSRLLAGKSFQDRAVLLNRVFATGLYAVAAAASSPGTLRRNPASEV